MTTRFISYPEATEPYLCQGRNGIAKNIGINVSMSNYPNPQTAWLNPVTSKNLEQNAWINMPLTTLVEIGQWAQEQIDDEVPDRTVKITVKGGCVEDVENLPPGWNYELDDKDIPDEEMPDED